MTDRSVASADPPVTVGAARPTEPPAAARLPPIMETMHAAGRRKLPPVPRNGTEPEPEQPRDPAQQFVARLRSAAADFASAAGAQSAVVREAVPPARHRRSRCRVVLRYADGSESDLTFLGPVDEPGNQARLGFDRLIQRWLESGQVKQPAWLVDDAEAPDGTAVDVSAWLAAV